MEHLTATGQVIPTRQVSLRPPGKKDVIVDNSSSNPPMRDPATRESGTKNKNLSRYEYATAMLSPSIGVNKSTGSFEVYDTSSMAKTKLQKRRGKKSFKLD